MASLVDQGQLVSDSISCKLDLKIDSFASVIVMLHDIGKASNVFSEYFNSRIKEISWELPTSNTLEFESFSNVISYLEITNSIDNASIKLPDRKYIFATYDTDSKFAKINFLFGADEFYLPSEASAFLDEASKMAKKLIEVHPEAFIELKRNTSSHFAPEPPLAKAHVYLTTTNRKEVEERYDDSEVFYKSWDKVEDLNGVLICSRALDCATDFEFKRKVYPRQWAMARAAKPKLTQYYMATPSPEEMDFFREGEPVLHDEGLYDPEQKLFEFECALGIHDTEQHIPPWQIFMVLDAVDTHQTPGGEPADTIRVAFAFEAMARREARVLLDIGAKVIYLNARAEDEEITD
jgi:hypothetical protein